MRKSTVFTAMYIKRSGSRHHVMERGGLTGMVTKSCSVPLIRHAASCAGHHLYGASRELRPVVPGCAATAERCMLMQCTSSPLRRSICSGRTMGPPRLELLATVFVAWRTNASSAFVLAVTCQGNSQHCRIMLANCWINHL